jgi:cytochrome P450
MRSGDEISLAELERDPDPLLARLRDEEPVAWVPAMGMWLVTRWDDVAYVDAHPELFSAATDPSVLARALGRNMLTLDPPEHTRVRDAMLPPFQPGGRSGAFVRDELAAYADRLLDAIDRSADGSVELMASYAQPLAAGSLAIVLGLDGHGADRMWSWCEGLVTDIANFEDDPALAEVGAVAKADLGAAISARIDEISVDERRKTTMKMTRIGGRSRRGPIVKCSRRVSRMTGISALSAAWWLWERPRRTKRIKARTMAGSAV